MDLLPARADSDVGLAVRPSVKVHKRGGVTIRDKGERRMNDVRGI